MEKSRAIELLKLAVPIKALTQQEYADFVEAVNMGMDALKAQLSKEGTTKGTTSDLISRKAAIDAAESAYVRNMFPTPLIREVPTVEPEPQWISVSERLPEDLEEVNVTWVNRNPESYYESIKDKPFTATAVYYRGKWYWWSTCAQDLLAEYGERCSVGLLHEAIEVTAWMPLPEPYKPNK